MHVTQEINFLTYRTNKEKHISLILTLKRGLHDFQKSQPVWSIGANLGKELKFVSTTIVTIAKELFPFNGWGRWTVFQQSQALFHLNAG